MEYGPRALGNRSIISSRVYGYAAKINMKIKFRKVLDLSHQQYFLKQKIFENNNYIVIC